MNKFTDIAKAQLSYSPLCNGRSQLSTEELYGKSLTIVQFDFANISDKGEEKAFPVILFNEYPESYYNGGKLLMNICQAWVDAYAGDIEQCNADLASSGGVQCTIKASKTRDGRNLTIVDIHD